MTAASNDNIHNRLEKGKQLGWYSNMLRDILGTAILCLESSHPLSDPHLRGAFSHAWVVCGSG